MSETTPDPADVHTGNDRVELTEDERLSIGAEVASFLTGRRVVDPNLARQWVTPGLARAVASIVAARQETNRRIHEQMKQGIETMTKVHLDRVHELTAERDAARAEADELRRECDNRVMEAVQEHAAESLKRQEALRAELAAANARCAELEAIAERNGVRWCACSRAARRRDEANPACPLHGEPMVQQRNALQATLDRISALADEWERMSNITVTGERFNADADRGITVGLKTCVRDLRAALTPEGNE